MQTLTAGLLGLLVAAHYAVAAPKHEIVTVSTTTYHVTETLSASACKAAYETRTIFAMIPTGTAIITKDRRSCMAACFNDIACGGFEYNTKDGACSFSEQRVVVASPPSSTTDTASASLDKQKIMGGRSAAIHGYLTKAVSNAREFAQTALRFDLLEDLSFFHVLRPGGRSLADSGLESSGGQSEAPHSTKGNNNEATKLEDDTAVENLGSQSCESSEGKDWTPCTIAGWTFWRWLKLFAFHTSMILSCRAVQALVLWLVSTSRQKKARAHDPATTTHQTGKAETDDAVEATLDTESSPAEGEDFFATCVILNLTNSGLCIPAYYWMYKQLACAVGFALGSFIGLMIPEIVARNWTTIKRDTSRAATVFQAGMRAGVDAAKVEWAATGDHGDQTDIEHLGEDEGMDECFCEDCLRDGSLYDGCECEDCLRVDDAAHTVPEPDVTGPLSTATQRQGVFFEPRDVGSELEQDDYQLVDRPETS